MLANILTFARLPLAAAFAVLVTVLAGFPHLPVSWALVLVGIALAEELTDLLDGIVARKTRTVTQLGGILDPAVDALSRLAMYFAMALAGWITIAVPFVMAARDILVAYTRIVQALTGGKTSARISGKLKALVQGGGVFVVLGLAVTEGWLAQGLLRNLRITVASVIIFITCWSLLDYLHCALPGIRELRQK